MLSIDPLRDMQDIPPRAHCPVCGAVLFEYDPGDLCPDCEEREEKENEE